MTSRPTSRSRRPYLIRAVYDWATDNGCTPHMLVAADYPGVVVPLEFVQEGRITLNIAPMAVQGLNLEIEPLWFSARFSGRSFEVSVPSGAVLAVFARENGEGIVFGEVEPANPDDVVSPTEPPKPPSKPAGGRSHLKLVK
ncbi:MAG: ClpXP protease specificity-enhancing factor [Pseudomonadota bacterium]